MAAHDVASPVCGALGGRDLRDRVTTDVAIGIAVQEPTAEVRCAPVRSGEVGWRIGLLRLYPSARVARACSTTPPSGWCLRELFGRRNGTSTPSDLPGLAIDSIRRKDDPVDQARGRACVSSEFDRRSPRERPLVLSGHPSEPARAGISPRIRTVMTAECSGWHGPRQRTAVRVGAPAAHLVAARPDDKNIADVQMVGRIVLCQHREAGTC